MTASGGIAGIGSGLIVTLTDYQTLSHYSGILGLYPVITVAIFLISEKTTRSKTNRDS